MVVGYDAWLIGHPIMKQKLMSDWLIRVMAYDVIQI
jgi:hypothetical protein